MQINCITSPYKLIFHYYSLYIADHGPSVRGPREIALYAPDKSSVIIFAIKHFINFELNF